MTALKQRLKRSDLVLFTEREAPSQRLQSNELVGYFCRAGLDCHLLNH
jgi:hypothetical protein